MCLYLRALWGECAAASCWPGRINSFPWGGEEGRRRGECWSYWCVPLLICRLLDYSQVLVAMILRASRKCRVCWFPDVTVDVWPPSVDAGTCRSLGIAVHWAPMVVDTGHRASVFSCGADESWCGQALCSAPVLVHKYTLADAEKR